MPQVWGPPMWYMLHVASTYANMTQDGVDWQNVIKSLPFIIPCLECREHARKFIESTPMLLPNANYLFVYLAKMHNRVNARTKKSILDYNDLAASYGMGSGNMFVRTTTEDGRGRVISLTETSLIDPSVWSEIFWFNLFNSAINFHSVLNVESERAIVAFIKSCHVLFPHEPTRSKLKQLLDYHPPHFFSAGRYYIFPYLLALYNRLNPDESMSEEEAKIKYGFDTFNASLAFSFTLM